MEIKAIGYNHPHDGSFIIDRPAGSGGYLFLILKTPAIVRLDDREEIVQKNSFVLYSEGTPQYYRACENEYVDDWFHFDVSREDIELFRSLEIPLNTFSWLGDVAELSSIIRSIAYEHYSSNPFRADVEELYLKIFFLKLSRQLNTGLKVKAETTSVYFDRMLNLRTSIFNLPNEIKSVDEMAAEVSMSRSGFQHTYKKLFGTSVINDVIDSRLSRAKYLLATTNLRLREVAEQSGYRSEIHLMRQFKKRFGITPSDYRKTI